MNISSPFPSIAALEPERATHGFLVLEQLRAGASLLDAAGEVGLSPERAAQCAHEIASAVATALRPFLDPDAENPQPLPRRVRPATWPESLSTDQA